MSKLYSNVKRMSVIMRHSSGNFTFTKGAVGRVIQSCITYLTDGSGKALDVTEEFRNEVLQNMEALAGLSPRVLALASKKYPREVEKGAEVDRASVESELVFRSLIGLCDHPRPEFAPVVRHCHEAGIEVHMLMGDYPETAKAIAIKVGILPSPNRMKRIPASIAKSSVMTASDLNSLTDDQVDELPMLPLVVARCAPSTKVRMIEVLHRRDGFCALMSAFDYSLYIQIHY